MGETRDHLGLLSLRCWREDQEGPPELRREIELEMQAWELMVSPWLQKPRDEEQEAGGGESR